VKFAHNSAAKENGCYRGKFLEKEPIYIITRQNRVEKNRTIKQFPLVQKARILEIHPNN